MRKVLCEIQQKTEGMSTREKFFYIAEYYWHYFLIGGVLLGLLVLLFYHFTAGDKKPVFQCVVVNQEIDYSRDSRIEAEFAGYLGIDADKIVFDSDYLISYDDVQLTEANESSYEKFFLNWQVHELDAVIMPESFCEYCERQGGEFCEMVELSDQSVLDMLGLQKPEIEKLFLCIPSDAKHMEVAEEFVEYVSQSIGACIDVVCDVNRYSM